LGETSSNEATLPLSDVDFAANHNASI